MNTYEQEVEQINKEVAAITKAKAALDKRTTKVLDRVAALESQFEAFANNAVTQLIKADPHTPAREVVNMINETIDMFEATATDNQQ